MGSSTGHLNNPHPSQDNPGISASGVKGHGKGARFGSFMLGWKWGKREEETKARRRLRKRGESKEKVKCDGVENPKKTKSEDENNKRKESSSSMQSNTSRSSSSPVSPKVAEEEKPHSKVRMR